MSHQIDSQDRAHIFEDDSSQDYAESFNSSVEGTVKYRNLDLIKSNYLSPFMINVLKSELFVMLRSHQNQHFSHFLTQYSEIIASAIHQRMISKGYTFIRKDLIRNFLKRLKHIFEAKVARGEKIDALFFWTQEEEEENERLERLQALKRTKKNKGGRPRKQGRGRKRPIMGFESISEAARQTGENYSYLRDKSRKADENSL